MKKSKLFLILALVLSLAVGLGGTLAYLTDTDEAVNVMTLGNVQIEQIELQRAEGVDYRNGGKPLDLGDLVPFQQGQELYPAYAASDDAYTAVQDNDEQLWWSLNYVNNGTTKGGSNGLWNDYNLKGAMDKFVFVKNTGSSDAYFRTWIALECPEGMEYGEDSDKEFMNNVNGSVTAYKWDSIGYAEIDGVRYCILAATYQKVLEPGKTSHPSLLQVVMTHNATNEDMKLLGNTYEILTFTQAVQTNNFPDAETALNAAFGAPTAANHPWKDAVIEIPDHFVGTADELEAALAKGGKIQLTADIECTGGFTVPVGAAIDGAGHSMTYTGTDYTYHLLKLDNNAAVKNITLNNYRIRTEPTVTDTVTLENVTINMTDDQTGLDISRGAGVAKLTNVTCKGTTDEAHLNPNTQVQVGYTPYGDVLLGTKWGLEASDCAFGSLHGWNTTNGSSVELNNTTWTVFRMHYWPTRTLYINGVETAWADSGAIPVAHDVGGCWSVQPAFK